MHVRGVEIEGFMSYNRARVRLPDCGIVLVSGPNATGKSALLEAISWGVWGTTIRGSERGTDPTRRDGTPCRVLVETDLVVVERKRRRGKAEVVHWRLPSEADWRPGTTATKAQADIDTVVGPASLWQRTAILSSVDASRFSGATDGERKRLLEAFLGLGVFDTALEVARKEAVTADREHATTKRTLEMLRTQEPATLARLERARTRMAEAAAHKAPPDAPTADIDALRRMHAGALADIRALPRNPPELAAAARARAGLDALRAQLARLGVGDCPVCSQPVPGQLRAQLDASVASAAADAAEAARTADAACEAQAGERDELQAEADALAAKIQEVQARQAQRDAYHQLHGQALLDVRDAEEAHTTLTSDIAVAHTAVDRTRGEVAHARAKEGVLSLRGVRAGVLHRAALGLAAAANVWLSRLSSTRAWVSLSDDEAGAGGKVPFVIHGMGGDDGFAACSNGERRRVDVALTMALAQVAAASAATKPGTLGADEVFDALDVDGIDAALAMLVELARDRAVIVITHTPDMAKLLRPAAVMRLHTGAGTLTQGD